MPDLLPPAPEADDSSIRPSAAAGWSEWLEADDDRGVRPQRTDDTDDFENDELSRDLHAEDPMAPLVEEARRRALLMRRRRQLLTRAALMAALVAVLAMVGAGAWLFTPTETPTAAPPSTPPEARSAAPTPAADAQANNWCRESVTPERVVSSGPGDTSTPTGVILRLEHAWYVQRDPVAVRSVIAPDARVAPESATREAISAIPAGTRHCVTLTALPADRWLVAVDERHPDGTQVAWQQVITTAQRDGRVLVTAIVESGGQ
ncbi:hypothetical protein HLB23_15355 [Nocardia uniformis]|uniref:DUF8176 domain-containing protein n=1 Tax=Nocardia uniformis TaxID=53432 RepID=A0A849C173_9NOCA|nr:hypothetical protein [Nocardia uniformis]NNH71226.1 hypothetical protein [Nocardia uniformis]